MGRRDLERVDLNNFLKAAQLSFNQAWPSVTFGRSALPRHFLFVCQA